MLSNYFALGLALLAGAGPATVSASPSRYVYFNKAADDTYGWTVTNWAAQYSEDDALCSYSFNISGPYSGGQMPIPAFVAWCAGAGVGTPYTLCHITDLLNTTKRRQVAAKLIPTTEVEASLAVTYKFDDLVTADSWWNYTSYATEPYSNTVAGGQVSLNGTGARNTTTFTMTPSEVSGVA
ncbi:hypothetical protein SCUCBS95973_001507 [Sporothrix curviconia]|uniref:Uncharacterized protein n=1 Tax=Sporothrix curviconia TaxID=1260050 RepID=A0ABP0AZ56_9PEZI